MRIIFIAIATVLCMSSQCMAEDPIAPVFEKIDELLTRVESGISLNTFAESYAQMKIDYKKAQEHPDLTYNPLLTDRMKDVMTRLDDYARAWKLQETDGNKLVRVTSQMLSKYSVSSCRVSTRAGDLYKVSCVKEIVMDELKQIIGKAKTAHFEGY